MTYTASRESISATERVELQKPKPNLRSQVPRQGMLFWKKNVQKSRQSLLNKTAAKWEANKKMKMKRTTLKSMIKVLRQKIRKSASGRKTQCFRDQSSSMSLRRRLQTRMEYTRGWWWTCSFWERQSRKGESDGKLIIFLDKIKDMK